jgi:hypothetical protein
MYYDKPVGIKKSPVGKTLSGLQNIFPVIDKKLELSAKHSLVHDIIFSDWQNILWLMAKYSLIKNIFSG